MTPHPDEGMLHAFIDGELSPGEATSLEAHVAECGLCGAALAEARGFVAGASRAISALDAAPSSASRPVVARPEALPAAHPRSKPFVFRVPFARAAALLLLAGGSAVVINRSTSDNGATSSAESLSADAALTEVGIIAEQPAQAVQSPTASATLPPAAPIAETDRSARRLDSGAGATAQKQVVTLAAPAAPAASAPAAAPVANDGNAMTDQALRERVAAAPPSAGAPSGRVGASGAAPTAATASGSVPRTPARTAASETVGLPSATPVSRVTRYRTRDGVTLTLTEEPLRTAFAEESTAARRGVARPMAQASAPVVNSYRWSSAEQGKSFSLTGALSVAELEATAKRLSELERVP